MAPPLSVAALLLSRLKPDFTAANQSRRDTSFCSHRETGEWGLRGRIKSYLVERKKHAGLSFTLTPIQKSLVAVRPIEDN